MGKSEGFPSFICGTVQKEDMMVKEFELNSDVLKMIETITGQSQKQGNSSPQRRKERKGIVFYRKQMLKISENFVILLQKVVHLSAVAQAGL